MKKFTKNEAIVVLAGTIIWILLMFSCYGMGLAAHSIGHQF